MRLLRFDKFVAESSSHPVTQGAQAQAQEEQKPAQQAPEKKHRPKGARKAVKVPGWKTY